jgi:hypothetical protein
MKVLRKKLLLLDNRLFKFILSKRSLVTCLVLIKYITYSQIGNYVSNGSFESLNSNSLTSYYNVVNYWQPIDTNEFSDYLGTSLPPISNIPYAYGFQYPRTGNNYIITQFYGFRGYPRNRLKEHLKENVVYCAKYYIVNTNNNPIATDGAGMYFASALLDTITKCNVALSYLTPQIQNPPGNIITDTLSWIAITGTFVATGNEKYLVIGNFKSDASTNTLLINPTYSNVITSDVVIEDVSVIEVNLPAYAGQDKSIALGDSVYIGRESDFAIDPGCIWYKLPNITMALDTSSGIWVKPTVTTTYVVKQTLECSPEKWDTVVVYMNLVGIEKLKMISEELNVFPIPAKDELILNIQNSELIKDFHLLSVFNNLGLLIREEELKFENGSLKVKTENLPNGVYTLQLKSSSNDKVSKRFVISR